MSKPATTTKEPPRPRGEFRAGEIVRISAEEIVKVQKVYGTHISTSTQLRVAREVPRGTYGQRRAYFCESRPGDDDRGAALTLWGEQLDLVAPRSVGAPWR